MPEFSSKLILRVDRVCLSEEGVEVGWGRQTDKDEWYNAVIAGSSKLTVAVSSQREQFSKKS